MVSSLRLDKMIVFTVSEGVTVYPCPPACPVKAEQTLAESESPKQVSILSSSSQLRIILHVSLSVIAKYFVSKVSGLSAGLYKY